MNEEKQESKIIGTRDFEEYLDRDVVILMWEGKYLYGKLRSFDQYNSITLENTIERVFNNGKYTERKCGLYIVRGENIVIIGLTNLKLSTSDKVSQEQFLENLKTY
ncbi:hypothetical protein EDEG_01573 [Edhazardia aedis USNM 41457]|uniref:U6 snRNA-associated Sm-like protein LSm1 n=1 Tax=Edhazardia aedis (strain USNM 41457) TaxID=1003232 RepID=J9DS63_EDHAE|nr:hypothetical protein EDEG_01573 [Edhazardia aedis USNM 41457]|eukprot:EJW04137.1 hypothetical protein EDEG_01573 [Edhazardia aedis USNM 41457]